MMLSVSTLQFSLLFFSTIFLLSCHVVERIIPVHNTHICIVWEWRRVLAERYSGACIVNMLCWCAVSGCERDSQWYGEYKRTQYTRLYAMLCRAIVWVNIVYISSYECGAGSPNIALHWTTDTYYGMLSNQVCPLFLSLAHTNAEALCFPLLRSVCMYLLRGSRIGEFSLEFRSALTKTESKLLLDCRLSMYVCLWVSARVGTIIHIRIRI